MKRCLLFTGTLLLLLVFSCGKETPCKDRNLGLALVGFDSVERSEIKVVAYKGGSAIDSAVFKFSTNDYFMIGDTAFYNFGALEVASQFIFNNAYEWKVSVPKTGNSLRVSDIQHEKKSKRCGGIFSLDCFPCYNPIVSLTLNGNNFFPDDWGVVYMTK